MSESKFRCDQAIFTSIRTPMGEGYRIIAASRGLRPDEKQVITRFSPSHDSLCWSPPASGDESSQRFAVAFYPLQSGRLCVALSCYAGAEHTGRGGQRVYTLNVVFENEEFRQCGYNPFAVYRSLFAAGLNVPQLKPAPVLPDLELPVQESLENRGDASLTPRRGFDAPCGGFLSAPWRGHVLGTLLDDQSLIITVPDSWLEVAETLLVGVPGPMRATMSFSAGLKFSVGRCHRLLVLHDTQGVTKSRVVGRNLAYLDPTSDRTPSVVPSDWLAFVERYWSHGDLENLSRRTSRPFCDVSHAGRERIARLYSQIDAISEMDFDALLDAASEHMGTPEQGVESEIAAELIVAAQQSLLGKLQRSSWADFRGYWPAVCDLARQSREGQLFVWPLLEGGLRSALRQHPLIAAEAALDVVPLLLGVNDSEGKESTRTLGVVLDDILARTAEWAQQAPDAALDLASDQLPNLRNVASRWQAVRPQCPNVQRMLQRCTRRTAATPAR